MKSKLKTIVQKFGRWPVIGTLIKKCANSEKCNTFIKRLIANGQVQKTPISNLNNIQLSTLLETISNLNHRLLTLENAKDNAIKSLPGSLRKITVDINSLRLDTNYLVGRAEFIRSELMYEMRYGNTNHLVGAPDKLATPTKIIATTKLELMRENKLRLNLGCGHIALEGYLNIDRRELPSVDIVAEIDSLPFNENEVDEIFSSHILEHFPQEQLKRELLPYFFKLLKSGGILHAIVPDAKAMIHEYTEGQYHYDDMREVIYGAQDYDGDFHFNMFTPASLSNLLQDAGFTDIVIVEESRRNGKCYEFEITGIHPET